MYLGDNLIGQDLTGFIEEFKNQGPECLIFLREVKDPSRFGVVILDEDKRVKKLIEKPREPISKLALVGVYIFSPLIHKAIQNINFSWRGELEITDAIQELLNMGKEVKAEVLNSWWLDTGKKDDLLEANRVVLDGLVKADIKGKINDKSIITGRAEIGKNTIVENSEIRGPVVIGKDAVIYGSFIGPYTSIGDGCHIEESSIEFSVILPEAKIRGIERLDESLIGRRTEVVKATKVNKALRLMLGDDAKVDL
jgi:glucose-1-phosphate thymidylyltransferase